MEMPGGNPQDLDAFYEPDTLLYYTWVDIALQAWHLFVFDGIGNSWVSDRRLGKRSEEEGCPSLFENFATTVEVFFSL